MKSLRAFLFLLMVLPCCTLSRNHHKPFSQFIGTVQSKTRLWLVYNENGQHGHGKGDALDTRPSSRGLIAVLPPGYQITFTKAYETWDPGGGGTWMEGWAMVKGEKHPVQFELAYDNDYGGYNPAQLFTLFQPRSITR
ncbi:hypothetical protein [Prosthecobacter sp.]|uniref:hypothetical protein n=1 Tax=Prosthecobacter sp. TaxID=1965333 RepID=UPI003784D377